MAKDWNAVAPDGSIHELSYVDLLIELACVFEVSLDYLILGKAISKNDAKNVLMQAAEYLTALADKSCE